MVDHIGHCVCIIILVPFIQWRTNSNLFLNGVTFYGYIILHVSTGRKLQIYAGFVDLNVCLWAVEGACMFFDTIY